MSIQFVADRDDPTVVAELSTRSPANPFSTARYFESMRKVGYACWVLGLRDDGGSLECGCGAFLAREKLNRMLRIDSLPAVGADSPFWDGLRVFCKQRGVTMLEINTFASPPGAEIASIGPHCTPHIRYEFVLDLGGDLAAMLSSNHKWNLKKAQKAGLTVIRTRSVAALSTHHVLMSQSMERRRSRGEDVPLIDPSLELTAFLQSGAGELFQTLRAGTVLSSLLVLHAPKGSYAHSAGTSPEGMAVGASHFLFYNIACQLSADGAELFYIGGATDEKSGLARFKAGFGALQVPLTAARYYIGPQWRSKASRGLALIQSSQPRKLGG